MNSKSWMYIIASVALLACEEPQDDFLLEVTPEDGAEPEPADKDSPEGPKTLADPAESNGPCPPSQGSYVALDASLGAHSLALAEEGSVWAWGRNNRGQLGLGSFNAYKNKPQKVTGISTRVLRIAAGENHSLALDEYGKVWAWGEGSNGQLGQGTTAASNVPKQVALAANIVSIAAGGAFSLALDNQGRVWAWGANAYGQLGNGGLVNSLIPKLVTATTGCNSLDAIAAGGEFAVALSGGQVCTWGRNNRGQLGIAGPSHRPSAAVVQGVSSAVMVTAGKEFVIVKLHNPVGWGDNSAGQFGKGNDALSMYTSPVSIGTLIWIGFRRAEAGASHTVIGYGGGFGPQPPGLGYLQSAGSNGHGQLARTAPNPSRTFAGLNRVGFTVAAGSDFTLVDDFESVKAAGKNTEGQLGDGTLNSTTLPTNVCLP